MGGEFNVNLMETDMASKLITIRGKVVNYVSEVINRIYGPLDHDIKASTDRDCASGAWLASKLCPGNNVPWAIRKAKILCSNLTAGARIWISIVCNRISPSRNIRNIPMLLAQKMACVLDNVPLNIGQLIVNEFR